MSFTMDWLDLLAVQGTHKSLLQHQSSKASIFRCSAFFTVQLSRPYMTTGKTIALTRRMFVGKVISLLLNMLSRWVITFLPRSKHLLISWLQNHCRWWLQPWNLGCLLVLNNRMGKTRDLFKKIRDIKGTFHAKMGTVKDRNGMDLTEAEYIKKRWQESRQELYKKISVTQITTMVWSLT